MRHRPVSYDPLTEVLKSLDEHIEAMVDLRTSTAELREYRMKLATKTRLNLGFALKQILPRKSAQSSSSIPAVRIPLEVDPDEK